MELLERAITVMKKHLADRTACEWTACHISGEMRSIVTDYESIPMDAEVSVPSETLPCEQDAEYGRTIKEKLKLLATENIPADMWVQCAHVLVRSMAETNSETAKVTITNFELLGKLYGDYEIKIKRIASKY